MILLVPIVIVPAAAGLLGLAVRSRRVMAAANPLAFGVTLALGTELLREVLAQQVVTEGQEFFRADALSVWMVLLISIVSLSCSLYAGRYFRRELSDGLVSPARVKEP